MNKDLDYYLSLPWQFEFEKASDGGYYANVKNLKCHSYGADMIEAANNIKKALECHLQSYIVDNEPVPTPIDEDKCNGKLSIRVARSLHCKLIKLAEREGVSISHLINDALVRTYEL